jgi:hypothetical protein
MNKLVLRVCCLAVVLSAAPAISSDLPDPKLTPGLANPALTTDVICRPGFKTRIYRSVPTARKREVFAEYGMRPNEAPCPCEVDHLIPIDLGGANWSPNLWPQSHSTSIKKDMLEKRLHDEVCAGKIELDTAQHEIAKDWVEAYRKWLGSP